jgi:hypothetical protein
MSNILRCRNFPNVDEERSTTNKARKIEFFNCLPEENSRYEMMYLDRDWKLMLNRDGEPYRLFDVKKDPPETEDLIGRKEYENLITELKTKLLDRRAQPQDV